MFWTVDVLDSVRELKNGLRGLFDPVRLGQVRIAMKNSIIEPLGSPIDSFACFGRKFERTVNNHVPQWKLFRVFKVNAISLT